VMSFLLTYPLGKKRLTAHLKQLIQNCNFEYEEGRSAALMLLVDVCRQFPVPILDDFAQLIFLPMALQVVNDISGSCRAGASDVIVALMRRCSPDKVALCLRYCWTWMGVQDVSGQSAVTPRRKSKGRLSTGSMDIISTDIAKNIEIKPLMRTGAQVLGLIVTGRPDVVKKSKTVPTLVYTIRALLHKLLALSEEGPVAEGVRRKSLQKRELSIAGQSEGDGDGGGVTAWCLLYHSLLLTEKFFVHLPSDIDACIMSHEVEPDLPLFMEIVQESLLYPHSWVRSVSCRILALYVARRDAVRLGETLTSKSNHAEFLVQHNGLYNFARRLCVTINQPVLTSNLLDSISTCLVFVIRALFHCRETSGSQLKTIELPISRGEEEKDDGPAACGKDGVEGANWVIQRLRGIGADSRGWRRYNVIKIFAALVKVESSADLLSSHLEQLIEVCIRSRISRVINEETEASSVTASAIQNEKDTKEAAGELLEAIEHRVGSSTFIGIYGEVQRRIESSKADKKRRIAAEAVADPTSYAQRKVKHAEKKKESKKRKNERFAAIKGIKKKKQSTNGAIIYEEL